LADTVSSRHYTTTKKARITALREELDVLKDKAVGRCLELNTEAKQLMRERARI
jgi:hypothetical protein